MGLASVAIPTALQQFVVLHVGPAYASTVFTLSPALTLAIAAGMGLERLVLRRVVGIALGLCGMFALIQQQLAQVSFGESIWVLLGLGIPLCVALGNVVRSAYWPEGSSALAFSCATTWVSACFLLGLSLAFEEHSLQTLAAPWIVGWLTVLVAASAISYVLNFRLQQIGGSVFFSQLGYWGTGFGVLFAALLFGDVLTLWSILALITIIAGGLMVGSKPATVVRTAASEAPGR